MKNELNSERSRKDMHWLFGNKPIKSRKVVGWITIEVIKANNTTYVVNGQLSGKIRVIFSDREQTEIERAFISVWKTHERHNTGHIVAGYEGYPEPETRDWVLPKKRLLSIHQISSFGRDGWNDHHQVVVNISRSRKKDGDFEYIVLQRLSTEDEEYANWALRRMF